MTERKYTLSKAERLSWKRYIDLLFEKGESFVAFPLRVVFLTLSKEEELPAVSSILISVSKKKFKRAVKRNLVKRQFVKHIVYVNMNLLIPLLVMTKRFS